MTGGIAPTARHDDGSGMDVLADAGTGLGVGVVVTAFGFGFRHGIDWDHLAAIGDITGSQTSRRRSLRLATWYAAGHAIVVLALGLAAVLVARRLPRGVDDAMQRVVGASLVVLGVWVLVGLARRGRDFRLRSRWMLLFALGRSCIRRLRRARLGDVVVVVHDHAHDPATAHHHHDGDHHDVAARARAATRAAGPSSEHAHHPTADPAPNAAPHHHVHRHVARMPTDPFAGYGSGTSFLVGMLHGVGAETPTQVLVLLTAAGVGGRGAGVVVLLAFVAGLLTSNSVVALAATFGFASAARNSRAYAVVSTVTAVCSLAVGLLFVTGSAGALPVISG